MRTLDLTTFQNFLESLRSLRSQPPSDAAPVPSQDREELASALREFVARLRDAQAELPLPGMGSFAFGVAGVAQARLDCLRAVLSAIQGAVVRWLPAQLGNGKITILKRCLATAAPPLLSVLGKETDENANSDVIAWLLNPENAPKVAPAALRRLVSLLDDAPKWQAALDDALRWQCVSVRREVVLQNEGGEAGDRDRIDILVTGPTFMLAIENKILSVESEGQTAKYWAWLKDRPILVGAMFLTPTGLPAQCREFRPISYLQLVDCLLEGSLQNDSANVEDVVLCGYLQTVAERILRCELRTILGAMAESCDESTQ